MTKEKRKQTLTSFSDKWVNNKKMAFDATLEVGSEIFNWITGRNGFKNDRELSKWLSPCNRILDAGCGNGE